MPRSLAIVTVAATAAVVAGPDAVAVAGGLLLAFALPGLALTAMLFRGRDLSAVERVLLAPALSLALLILSGLLMYAAGIDLDRTAWTSATAGVTLIALLASALPPRGSAAERVTAPDGIDKARRRPALAAATAARVALGSTAHGMDMTSILPPDSPPAETPVRLTIVPPLDPEAREPEAEPGIEPAKPRRLARQLIPLALVLAMLAAAAWQSYDSSRDRYEITVTALSAAPPAAVDGAGQRTVEVTATGLVAAEGPYTVAVVGDDGVRTDERAATPTDGLWKAELTVSGRERVTIGLYRSGETDPFRSVIIAAG